MIGITDTPPPVKARAASTKTPPIPLGHGNDLCGQTLALVSHIVLGTYRAVVVSRERPHFAVAIMGAV